jgi:hypothetical protein
MVGIMKRNQSITKKSALGLLGLSLIIVTVSSTQAAWIPLTGAPVPVSSLPVGGLAVGDKLFTEFEVTGISAGGAPQPNSATVLVQGGQDEGTGDYGLRFRLAWNAGTDQFIINANINFKVSIISGYPRSMEAATLWLSTCGATGTGSVQASENIYDADFLGNSVLALAASTQDDDYGALLLDRGNFVLHGNPAELKEIWVRTGITVQGGTNGTAGLNEVFTLFSQIPDS